MSTIPTTSKPRTASYTVVGGARGSSREHKKDLSIILLNRGGIVDRGEVLESFAGLEPDEILSIEASGDLYAIEKLAMRFPRIKFVLLHEPANVGEQINIGMEEANSRFAAVFWSDMRVFSSTLNEKVLTCIREESFLCAAPWLFTDKNELLPILQVPTFHKKRLKVLPMIPQRENAPSLYPFDYCGVYRKEAYVLLGGYDSMIQNSYWQKLDFGFRGHLWGERIVSLRGFRCGSIENILPDDTTPDEGYRIFFLKNLAVRFTGDAGELSRRKFFAFFLHSGSGLFTAIREFRSAQKWVELNAYRFKMDSTSVTELWEDPDQ